MQLLSSIKIFQNWVPTLRRGGGGGVNVRHEIKQNFSA